VRLRALATPVGRQTLGRALFGDEPDSALDPVLAFFLLLEYARLDAADPIGPYMIGRQLVGRDAARALPYLRRACGDGELPPPAPGAPSLSPDFIRECRRQIADAAYRVGDWPRARTALDALDAEAAREGDQAARLRAHSMRARVDWAAARRRGAVEEAAAAKSP
jgi:hypothetical protein